MDVDEIIEAIGEGQFDGRLDEIAAAMVERARSGQVEFMWRLRCDGDEWDANTVTLGELAYAEQLCWVHGVGDNGRPFRRRATAAEIDPRASAEHASALIVAHFHRAQHMTVVEAVKRAEAITAAELKDIVGEHEVVHPPKDDPTSEPSTSSSGTA